MGATKNGRAMVLGDIKIDVIIPAFNEQDSIVHVLHDIPEEVREVIVVNNNSTDKTVENARNHGATVLTEPKQGYGFACLKGINYLKEKENSPDVVVFIDADYSDYPDELPLVAAPILYDQADMVIGSRSLGTREKKSMLPQQIFGNWLAITLIRILYKVRYTDLGPFRAIRFPVLVDIDMQDTTYGWTVEMQLKAAKMKLDVHEVPVSYRRRIGVSKITGTVKGTVLAGYKIITTIFKYAHKK